MNALVGLAAARADWVKVLGTKGVDLAVLAGVGLARAGSAALVRAMGVAAARPAEGPDGPGAGSAAGARRGAESEPRAGVAAAGAGRPQRVHWVASSFQMTGSSRPVSSTVLGRRPSAGAPAE